MISIEQIRQDPDGIRSSLATRGEADQVTKLLAMDGEWRRDKTEADEIRRKRNHVNRQIGHARSAGEDPSPEVIQEMRTLGQQVDALDSNVQDLEQRIHEILLGLPNIPLPDTLIGEGEEDNKVIRQHGEPQRHEAAHRALGPGSGFCRPGCSRPRRPATP